MSKEVKKCIIPVGGLGTRFLPASKEIPKEMFPLVNKPTIQYIVEEAIESGIEDIILVSSPTKESIVNHFDRNIGLETRLSDAGKEEQLDEIIKLANLAKFISVRQGEPQGSAKAVYQARDIIGDEPFAVMYGDDIMKYRVGKPVLKQLIDVYKKTNANVIAVTEVDPKDAYKYGIIKYKNAKTGKIDTIVEKPKTNAPSNFAGVGRYILDPEIFDIIETLPKGVGKEYQLTDAMKALMKRQEFYACDFDGEYLDCGSKLGMIKAQMEFGLDDPEIKNQLLDYMNEIISREEKTYKIVKNKK